MPKTSLNRSCSFPSRTVPDKTRRLLLTKYSRLFVWFPIVSPLTCRFNTAFTLQRAAFQPGCPIFVRFGIQLAHSQNLSGAGGKPGQRGTAGQAATSRLGRQEQNPVFDAFGKET